MTQQRGARTRLAVDIGGTFTDLVLELPDRTLSAKLLTTHTAPDEAVIEGTEAILREAGIAASSLDLVIHGTTLATNALIERKGARTALITTDGFRDSLEIAYEHRFEQYDLYMERPEPLVSRDLRLEVPERLAADGSVLLALDENALKRLAAAIRQRDIEALAISLPQISVSTERLTTITKRAAAYVARFTVVLSAARIATGSDSTSATAVPTVAMLMVWTSGPTSAPAKPQSGGNMRPSRSPIWVGASAT